MHKMHHFLWSLAFFLPFSGMGQTTDIQTVIRVLPCFEQKVIVLDGPIRTANGDSLAFHALRIYLSNFVFYKNGMAVFIEKDSHHLLDLEEPETLDLPFSVPANLHYDEIAFDVGIDSLTHASGAMGGDLDPTKGMFWGWQGGYINVKIEGYHSKCLARKHLFQFHLGGYLPPFPTLQSVRLHVSSNPKTHQIMLDLSPFLAQIDWSHDPNVMAPCLAAKVFSKTIAQSFRIHAQ
jgi:hypothetical protein